jgi:Outer membrane protein beta-barrel domain
MSVCIFAARARAQKNELAGLIGKTFISDQTIPGTNNLLTFGKGWTGEVNFARRVIEGQLLSVSVEIPFQFNPDEDVHTHANPVTGSYKAYFLTPAARLNLFSKTAVSPWVSVGGGFGHFNGNAALAGSSVSTTNGVFQVGGGLDVILYHRFSLRGELRDFWSGVPSLNVSTNQSRQHNLFVGVGIVWHF